MSRKTLPARLRAPRTHDLVTVRVTGTPAVAVGTARRLAQLNEVVAMRHSPRHNQTSLYGQPVIRIDVTYRVPGRSR